MVTATALPRVLIAAPASSQGKTTVAIGLMAALRASGRSVAGFKVGPDYIDPGYHALACGRPGRNLDPYLCGPERIAPLFAHGALHPEPADISVVEGVMGMFDGKLGAWPDGTDDPAGFGSSAHIARLLDAPVLLVVDGSHSARTAAALCHGLASYDPRIHVAGVILNRVMGARVVDEITRGCARVGLPVLGALPKSTRVAVGSRHLGLVTADEQGDAIGIVQQAGELVAAHLDLDAIATIAGGAPDLAVDPWDPAAEVEPVPGRPVIAMASGPAFTFRYTETAELLEAAGCRVTAFDPLTARGLPADVSGLYLGGGFPEEHAEALAGNTSLGAEIASRVSEGLPTVAECAGLLYLCRSLDGLAMAGVVDADSSMTPRLTIGYHHARAANDSFLMRAGERYRAHEFHRTTLDTPPYDRDPGPQRLGDQRLAWDVETPTGGNRPEGVLVAPTPGSAPSVHASYQHLHWAGSPVLAQRFARAASEYGHTGHHSPRPAATTPGDALSAAPDLTHHGDRDVLPGLVDLAVNVRDVRPPAWLVERIVASSDQWAHYPDQREATRAVALRHGVNPDQVLLTAGSSEAFSLIAHGFSPRWAVVVHPQFTEPEVALRNAGRPVGRLVLHASDGFQFDHELLDPRADMVVIGNPTNPTGVLHSAASLRALCRPGRVVVVDEAFMDAVPGEPESLIGARMDGLLVTRSFTKTWSVPGLRIGYVVGDPALIRILAHEQPCWPISTPALVTARECSTPRAVEQATSDARQAAQDRRHLVARLAGIGIQTVGEARAPFVLVDLRAHPPGGLRAGLRTLGFTVRSGESFPGLGAGWLRLAVRHPDISDAFVAALARTIDALDTAQHPMRPPQGDIR
ncbi:cobyrinate a,c-diamide synthase [Propionibacterium freudenreichii]|uniref:cobyrinate a,c-diamide synthase n=1 Tax=Propionibacterium freudenreichii TaxID=1744 RepID=UPI00070D6005|nr:cobyrinate a,c-diamide synthase [Propionibacterium freudenreichii]MDK9674922.1 cobyrinate a,c-diamide synthase [Propionibacterium freudenreichii]SCQ46040.1 Cobyrinic acid a,c-diamide synthase [Propionibacterium freudenreichii]SCQ51043.1 Cobyrinic acid a,c-diamide synthase [Propionibacterium freudenreichii]